MVPQIISTSKLQHLKEEKTKNSLDRMKIQTIDLRQNNFHVEMQKKQFTHNECAAHKSINRQKLSSLNNG